MFPNKTYKFQGSPIVAPLEIMSERQAFSVDTIDLRRFHHVQPAQRWGLRFSILPGLNTEYLLHSTEYLHDSFSIEMPQPRSPECKTASASGGFTICSPGGISGSRTVYFDFETDLLPGDELFDEAGNGYGVGRVDVFRCNGAISTRLMLNIPLVSDTSVLFLPSEVPQYLVPLSSSKAYSAGVDSLEYNGTQYIQGRFLTFENHEKVYLCVGQDESEIRIFPTLQQPVEEGTTTNAENPSIKVNYDVDSNLSGIQFLDGILADPGIIRLLEQVG